MKKTTPVKSLSDLATTANEQAEQGEEYAKQAVDLFTKALSCYRAAGSALRQAKKQLHHGKWQDWVKANFKKSFETAQLYMRVDREWNGRLAAAVERGDVGSLSEARSYLSGPPDPKDSTTAATGNVTTILEALWLVKPGISRREVIEDSDCFIFEDGKKLRTFNDAVACEIDSPLDITGAIPAAKLLEMLTKLSDQKVDVAAENGKLIFTVVRGSKRAEFNIETSNLSFDTLESPGTKWKKLPDPEAFAEAIRITSFCAGNDYGQFELVCLNICPTYIESFDLYQGCRYFVKTGLKEPILIDHFDLMSFPRDAGLHEFNLTDNWIHFRNNQSGYIYSVRHHADKYPDLDKLYNQSGDDLQIPKKPLRKAIDKAGVFAKYKRDEGGGNIEIRLKSKSLLLKSYDEAGKYSERLKIKYDGDPLTFVIPLKMLNEVSKRTNEYRIIVSTITGLATKNDDFQFVVAVTTDAQSTKPAKGKKKKKQPQIAEPPKQLTAQES